MFPYNSNIYKDSQHFRENQSRFCVKERDRTKQTSTQRPEPTNAQQPATASKHSAEVRPVLTSTLLTRNVSVRLPLSQLSKDLLKKHSPSLLTSYMAVDATQHHVRTSTHVSRDGLNLRYQFWSSKKNQGASLAKSRWGQRYCSELIILCHTEGIQDHAEQGCQTPTKSKQKSWVRWVTKHCPF